MTEAMHSKANATGRGTNLETNCKVKARNETSFATTSTRQTKSTKRNNGNSLSLFSPGGSQRSKHSAMGARNVAIMSRTKPSWNKRRTDFSIRSVPHRNVQVANAVPSDCANVRFRTDRRTGSMSSNYCCERLLQMLPEGQQICACPSRALPEPRGGWLLDHQAT